MESSLKGDSSLCGLADPLGFKDLLLSEPIDFNVSNYRVLNKSPAGSGSFCLDDGQVRILRQKQI